MVAALPSAVHLGVYHVQLVALRDALAARHREASRAFLGRLAAELRAALTAIHADCDGLHRALRVNPNTLQLEGLRRLQATVARLPQQLGGAGGVHARLSGAVELAAQLASFLTLRATPSTAAVVGAGGRRG